MKTYQQTKENKFSVQGTFSNFVFQFKPLLAKGLLLTLLISNLLIVFPNSNPVYAQQVVTVTADQPNIWTLEQAHYLLAQMHRRNLDLKAKGIGELDANEINGVNIDILRSILEIGATYDDANRFNNNLTKQDKTFNAERRRELTKDIDNLNKEKLELTKDIARLKREKELAESDDEKAKIDAQIAEKTEIKAEVDAQIESKSQQLTKLSSANGDVSNTTSSATFNSQKFPTGVLDDTFRSKAAAIIDDFKAKPQLNASLQLDKFLQLQYEIISKQLTLLRDEVGPGERLLFLELPQSINAPYDKSNNMWAQSRWRVRGFTKCEVKINNQPVDCHKLLYPTGIRRNQNRQPRTILDIFDSVTKSGTTAFDNLNFSLFDLQNRSEIVRKYVERNAEDDLGREKNYVFKSFFDSYNIQKTQDVEKIESDFKNYWSNYRLAEKKVETLQKECATKTDLSFSNCENSSDLTKARENLKEAEKKIAQPPDILVKHIIKILNQAIVDEKLNKEIQSSRIDLLNQSNKDKSDKNTTKILNRLWIEDLFSDELHKLQESDFPSKLVDLEEDKKKVESIDVDNRSVRTIEIIPRQSSLNVNDVKIRNKSSVFSFLFSTLFGIGANFNYQQQRENFSQFVQQELYSSGFGKGSREFGWTFTSMPGSDRLLSGTRNTYAVVIVPQEATSVVIESTGCSFKRTTQQPKDFKDAITNWTKYSKNICSNLKNFVIPIPGGGFDSNNDFSVSGLTYESVEKGKRVLFHIYGNNFSSQIGVMINGVPLLQSIGLAQSFVVDDSGVRQKVEETSKSEKVKGNFERVDSNQIIASFELVDGENGTPTITLVSPGKAIDLNSIPNLYINNQRNTKLSDAEWMFGKKPTSSFKVTDTQLFVSKTDENKITELTAIITGSSFGNISNVFVNGRDPIECIPTISPCKPIGTRYYYGRANVYRITFPPPEDEKIHIVLVSGNDTFKLSPIANPAKAKKPKDPPVIMPSELSFTIKKTTQILSDDKKKVAFLLVEIEGKGFTSELNMSSGQLDILSETKAYITISDPKPAQTIRLTDNKKNVYAEGVIVNPDSTLTPMPTPTPTPKP